MHCTPVDDLQDQLQRFWEMESLPNNQLTKPDDEYCETHFVNTHKRTPLGQYLVCLPKKTELPAAAAETRNLALRSLYATERRFNLDDKLAKEYLDFMEKYKSDGHMELIPKDELNNPKAWYIPHHAVIKQINNLDWKLRVVFNASRLTSLKLCLNDFLHAGPALQKDIGLILLNWRSPESPIDEYRLCTVTYGTACAPYLAIRTLKQLVIDEGALFPLGAECLQENTYVDDIFDGGDDVLQAAKKRNQVINLCAKGNLKLDKWATNHPELLPFSCESPSCKTIDQLSIFKTLGILWNSNADHFEFKFVQETFIPENISKRTIASCIAKLYDPLGWLSPITVAAKIMLQDIWILRVDWDAELPTNIQKRWTHYYESLTTLSNVKIPRWLRTFSNSQFELHGFSDASSRAYAAAVYLRVIKYQGIAQVTLLAAKSKVSPIKTVSIPNLELCGAVLLTRLLRYVRRLTHLKNATVTAWCDSQVTLAWLNQHPSRWKTFVANRVSYIQTELPSAVWRHVSSHDNPADLATRGISPETLHDSRLWWNGPQWLSLPLDKWPSQSQESEIESTEIQSFLAVRPEVDDEILSRFSSLKRLFRVVAYCLRICRIFKGNGLKDSPEDTSLSVAELASSKSKVLVIAQTRAFAEDIATLRREKCVPKSSVIRNLNPFLDEEGVLRVGGRLTHSSLAFSKKHPPILPKDSPLAPLYVDLAHKVSCHGGPKLTLSILRNLVWVIGASSLVRKLVRKCALCHRVKPRFPTQLMGDLPPPRIEPARPFTNSGLDYAGPFHLRTTKGRGFKSYKGYIVIFICFATKAIHLEAVSDMTTASFMAAFRRFTGRRGLCRQIFSDNGTTFQGADRELRSMFKRGSAFYSETAATLANDGTEWRFIPPNSPHFGGLWEAGVKSAKHHLTRMMFSRKFTFEEFSTLLVEIEACLNSRPLCAMSTDPEELNALTPAHFLIGSTLSMLTDEEPPNIPENRLNRHQLLQKIRNHFWKKWSSEYLQSLQARGKWQQTSENLSVGQLVLIRDDRYPPTKWPLGKVIEVHPGSDGRVRVATVKTNHGTYRRSIVRLSPIPSPN
ncbi:uncharacterized protein LOC122501154 [Leptopilina heterotoma]|uniref:uncharacterized protein LOC122501154 n=1 Tax=Leptopilina heterotoma TaxID=63436 RepID=UPI001CA85972|nr:uncharacterized protein LOC122501154 [Leptopilina heterotoma]